MVDAGVCAEIFALGADEMPGFRCESPLTDIGGIISVRDKADLHRVRRIGTGKVQLTGHGTDVIFLEFSQGKDQLAENILRQTVKHIALVAGGAFGHGDPADAVVVNLHTGIMAGGYPGTAQLVGLFRQQTELDKGIACDAGIGGLPGAIAFTERLDHKPLKGVLCIDDVQWNAEGIGGFPGGRNGALVRRRKTDDGALYGKSLILQNADSDAGIHAAAHAHQNGLLLFKGVETFHRSPPCGIRPAGHRVFCSAPRPCGHSAHFRGARRVL